MKSLQVSLPATTCSYKNHEKIQGRKKSKDSHQSPCIKFPGLMAVQQFIQKSSDIISQSENTQKNSSVPKNKMLFLT